MREQAVTHADHKCHTSAGKKKRRQKHSRSTAEMRMQEVTYANPRAHTSMLQGRQMPTVTETRVSYSPSSPWRITAVTLGILCLALLAAVGTLGAIVLQASHEVRNINKNLTKHEEVPKSLTQLQENLENCIKQRDNFQSQIPHISNEAERKGEKCSRCSKSWLFHEEKCYLFSNEKKTWNDSKKHCFTQDSTLMSINNESEKDFITPLLRDHWIGLSRRDATSQPHWEDGTAYATDLFSKKMSVHGEGPCAFVNNGVISLSACTKLAHFICEKMAIQ